MYFNGRFKRDGGHSDIEEADLFDSINYCKCIKLLQSLSELVPVYY